MKFLIPFAALVSLGGLLPKPAAPPPVAARMVEAFGQFAAPLTLPIATREPFIHRTQAFAWESATFAVWLCGFAAISLAWLVRWRRMRSLCNSASPFAIATGFPVPIKSSAGLMEPGVFGIFRQVLLLPEGIVERLSVEELGAILAHESCHVRRRDNLTATLHMVVQAVFWFHPIVWWLGARMIHERERACDEEVLRLGNKPQIYAAGILNVCRHYMEAPLACISGVTGSNLKRRIEAILAARNARRLGLSKIVALTLAAVTAVALPLAIGILHAPLLRAQAVPQSSAKRFEVASIKRCKEAGPTPQSSPGRLSTGCVSLRGLIRMAFVLYSRGRDPSNPPVEGGPAWIDERYEIVARAEDSPSLREMSGPMLQRLLEDRFALKLHTGTKEVPVYDLVVAKGGPKLHPFHEGGCIPLTIPFAPQNRPPAGQRSCRVLVGEKSAQEMAMDIEGLSLGGFAKMLDLVVDRPVIDKTGITGLFDFHLEYGADGSMVPVGGDGNFPRPAPSEERTGVSIFTAIQQYGLKLESAKGPREFFAVDRVERPSEN